MTTYMQFDSGLANMQVTGVSASGRLAAPPPSVPVLPCSFPVLPRAEQSPIVFNGGERWAAITCDFIVLTEAAGQSTLAANKATTLAMMDNVHEALAGLDLGRTRLSWSIQPGMYPIGDTNYWAVIATVQGRG